MSRLLTFTHSWRWSAPVIWLQETCVLCVRTHMVILSSLSRSKESFATLCSRKLKSFIPEYAEQMYREITDCEHDHYGHQHLGCFPSRSQLTLSRSVSVSVDCVPPARLQCCNQQHISFKFKYNYDLINTHKIVIARASINSKITMRTMLS